MGELIKDWATISANTIEALKIMGMGILAIFIVISIIMIVVYILNAIDKKIENNKKAMALMKTAPVVASESKAIETAPVPKAVVPTQSIAPAPAKADSVHDAPSDNDKVTLDELTEPKYRKTGDPYPDSKYRKSPDDED